jgi:hypothetical protein
LGLAPGLAAASLNTMDLADLAAGNQEAGGAVLSRTLSVVSSSSWRGWSPVSRLVSIQNAVAVCCAKTLRSG